MRKESICVLMCCSDLERVKGGMVTMVKNLLAYKDWETCELSFVPTHVEGNKVAKTGYFAVSYMRVLGKLLFGEVDILHLHVSERGSIYRKAILTKLAKIFRKKVILHHHGADFHLFFQELTARQKKFVVKFLESADCNLVLSEGVREEFFKKAPNAKYAVMRNAVRVPARNQYQEDANLIITMGRLGQRKGTYDLVEALKVLDKELPEDIQFCFCGDGEVEKVKAMIVEYGLEQRVCHVGWVSGKEKEDITKKAMCHVLPSYREVLPMSILETMALGIPNISTKIASIPEVITEGEDGLLIQAGDVEGLTEALRTICQDKKIRQQMSEKAYRRIQEEYSVEACSRKLIRLYKEVVNGSDV